jgi:hypothetical protein
VTIVAHEIETISANGLDVRAGELIVPTPDNIRRLEALSQLVVARYLDTEGNLARLPGRRPNAPLAPPKGSDRSAYEAYDRDFATWNEARKLPIVGEPVPPAVGYPRVTENDAYYTLDPLEGDTQTILPYTGIGSALFRVQFAEIAEAPPLTLQ